MTRPLVVAGSRMLPAALRELKTFARTQVNRHETPWTQTELGLHATQADAIIAFMPDRIDAALLARCPRLRLVAGALKGADNIDLVACAAHGVQVSVVEDLLSIPTAELALALTLGLLRRVREGDVQVRQGHDGWRPALYGSSLVGGTVGMLGMGSVGRALARLLAGLVTRIVYHDPQRLPAAEETALHLHWCSAAELPAACGQALILVCPLTAGTAGWLSAARLRRLARDAVVVNVGRGSVADETAVLAALTTGRLAGYAADVFAFEDLSRTDRPPAVASALLAHPRTLFTPHLGSAVLPVRLAIERQAVAAVRTGLATSPRAEGPLPI